MYLYHGLAASTRKTYQSGINSYFRFLDSHPQYKHPNGSGIPAPLPALLEWCASLGGDHKPATIKAYITHVRSAHLEEDVSDEHTHSPVLQRLIRGIARAHDTTPKIVRLPITADMLRQVLLGLPSASGRNGAVLRAACTLAFAAFLRCGEFTVPSASSDFSAALHLTPRSIQWFPSFESPTHFTLRIPASKTDPFRLGVTVLVAAAPPGSPTCPVTAMHHLFTAFPPTLVVQPLFELQNGKALHREYFIQAVKKALTSQGVDSSKYSGHSFRKGAASSASEVGISEADIQLLGRWRSNAVKLYVQVSAPRLLSLSSSLHLAPTPVPALVSPILPSTSPSSSLAA